MKRAVPATRGVPRVLRGVTLAGMCAALTVAAHTAAGGSPPSTALTLVLTALLAGIAIAIADRRRGFPAILAVVGASQAGMHLLLSALGHGHAAVPSARMALLHAVAATAVAVLVAGAENAVFAAASVVDRIFGAVTTVALAPPAPAAATSPVRPVAEPGSAVAAILLRRVHSRRGPPDLP